MGKGNIKYILFDVGNVLVYKKTHEDENVGKLVGLSREEYRELLDSVIANQTESENNQFRGIDTVEKEYTYLQELHRKICNILNIEPTDGLVEKMTMCRMKGDFVLKDGVIDTLRKLSDHSTLGILSNALPSRRVHELKIDNLDSFFKDIFISHEIGLSKPDVRVYEYVLERIGVDANEVLFVDDKYDYLKGAEKVGITNLVMVRDKDEAGKYMAIDSITELLDILNV